MLFGFFHSGCRRKSAVAFYALYDEELGIPLGLIALIPTLFFGLQIETDAVFSVIVAKIGYRATAVIANALSASGLITLGFSPLFSSAIAAIFVSTSLCALGSGIIEITTSPLVEALPGDGKSAAMSVGIMWRELSHWRAKVGSAAERLCLRYSPLPAT